MSVTVRLEWRQEAVIVRLDGVADRSLLIGLSDSLRPIVDEGRTVIFDVSGLELSDPIAARELLARLAEMDREGDVRLACGSSLARVALGRANRGSRLRVFESVEEAVPGPQA